MADLSSPSIETINQNPRASMSVLQDPRKRANSDANGTPEDRTYRFQGFSDRDLTFNYIRKVWSNSSPFANDEDDTESSEEDQEGDGADSWEEVKRSKSISKKSTQ